jgi:superfamily I DNA/RNA helicase
MEDALRRQGIPYKIYGNVSFYQRKEIKNVLAYCRWAVNPYDEQALLSCINNPRRGIGDTSIDRLQIFARENGVPMWDLIKRANSVTAGGAGIAGIAKAVKTKAADIMGTDSAKGAKVENVKITEARKARNAGEAGGSDTANWNDGNIAEAAIVEANSEKDAKAGNAKITEARKTRNVGETDIDDTANWSDVNIADAGIPAGTLNKMATLALKVEKWYMLMPVTPADELLETIWAESDLKRAYEDEATSESKDRIQNVEELIGSVREWVKGEHTAVDEQTGEMLPYNGVATLAMFLPEIALLTDQDTQDERDERNSDKVVLMTIHSAKGLEFPYVFVAGLEDGLFPSSFGGERCDLEEERRLFYVAITRAKKQLWLSCAGMRFLHGNLQSALPSPFLLELDSQYAEVVTNGGATGNSSSRHYGRSSWAAGGGGGYGGNYGEYGKSGSNFIKRNAGSTHADGGTPQNNPQNNILPRGNFKKVGQAKSAPPPERIYVTGQKVIHNKFGKGTILEIMGDGSNQKLIIDFSLPIGTKTLLATFAKLEVI